jgi:hypothetical protein
MKHFIFNKITDNKTDQAQNNRTEHCPPKAVNRKSFNGSSRKIKHKAINNESKKP